jgi:membrane-bound lytic murein transglycosylase D
MAGMINRLFMGSLFLLIAPVAISGGYDRQNNSSFSAAEALHLNKRDRQFVESYIQDNRRILFHIKQKGQSRFTIADAVLHKYGLPPQLKYLAVIESDLKSNAVSRVGAVGPWQLMPETARLLGLKVTDDQDERTQFGKSTRAAARHLKDLFSEYGDWLLVLAAYNGGEGPVNHAIRKAGNRNFWLLQNYLPAESRDHVKKFIATLYYFEGPSSAAAFSRAAAPAPLITAQSSYQKRTTGLD